MEILFATRRLEVAASSPAAARQVLGQLGERYIKRLALLTTAATWGEVRSVSSLRVHQLKGLRRGQWSITLSANYRLVVSVKDETVLIESVEDYHGD